MDSPPPNSQNQTSFTIPETGGGQFDPFTSTSTSSEASTPVPPPLSPTSLGGGGLQMTMGGRSGEGEGEGEGGGNDQPPGSTALGYGWASNLGSSPPTGQKMMDRSKSGSMKSEKSNSPTSTRRSSGTLGVGTGGKNGNLKEEGKESGERRKRGGGGGGGRKKESGAGKA